MLQIRKAEKKKTKLRLALLGSSGSGKTYSSLLIAKGLGNKILIIDTENGSADLYADSIGFDYDVITLTAPYTPQKYIEAMKLGEAHGYDVIILDSISHAWSGEGGLLEQHGNLTDTSGNSFTAWRKITPLHNQFVEAMIQSKSNIIATMRAKTEYVQDKDEKTGKIIVRKIGMSPVQRDGVEYEFTAVFDINQEHIANASKDRTGLFDNQFFTPTIETGQKLRSWIESETESPTEQHTVTQRRKIFELGEKMGLTDNEIKETIKTKYGLSFFNELTRAQAEDSIQSLEKRRQYMVEKSQPQKIEMGFFTELNDFAKEKVQISKFANSK